MSYKPVENLIDNTLKSHKLAEPVESKTWSIRGDRHSHWYNIVWTPGIISLNGNIGDMTLTHHHAMPTWMDAVSWVNDSEIDYLLEKTNMERTEIDFNETLCLIEKRANEFQTNHLWKDLFAWGASYVDDLAISVDLNGPLNPDDPHDREFVIQMIRNAQPDISSFDIFRYNVDIIMDYPNVAYWRIKAIMKWANLVHETYNFQNLMNSHRWGMP